MEEEGEMQALMFVLLQDQHKSQLEAMAVVNKATMDAMMECMNTILSGGGGRTSKRKKKTPTRHQHQHRGGDEEAKTVQALLPLQQLCVPQTR